jgi:hypothetical protein
MPMLKRQCVRSIFWRERDQVLIGRGPLEGLDAKTNCLRDRQSQNVTLTVTEGLGCIEERGHVAELRVYADLRET